MIVHLVFAMIYYQFSIRNSEDTEMKSRMNDLSNNHYHWCVDKTWDLASESSLASMQALVLMAVHCRCFPKPGAAWIIVTMAWSRVIDMDLHRPFLKKGEPTTLENEMRKRVFWCLFMIMITIYGRLGKPMPIRLEDFDVDYPMVIPDECLTEEGIIEQGRNGDCHWLVASASFKLAVLFLEMYNKVYSVRQDPKKHVEAIRHVEERFRLYRRSLPDELKLDRCKPKDRVMATYLEASNWELMLCLRHPARCITDDPVFIVENYRICEEASKKVLNMAMELARLKSLDTTWYQMAVYVAAVFTLLASHWLRRAEITHSELASLKEEMSKGLSIINEVMQNIRMLNAHRLLKDIFIPYLPFYVYLLLDKL